LAFGGVYPTIYFNDIWLFELLVLPDVPSQVEDNNILSYFSTLLDDDRFVDIRLLFDSGDHHMCHRIVLCSRSNYFRKLLDGWSCENIANTNLNIPTVRIKELKYEVFQWIKVYLYKGILPIEATDSAENIW
jgi:hypothetical protein